MLRYNINSSAIHRFRNRQNKINKSRFNLLLFVLFLASFVGIFIVFPSVVKSSYFDFLTLSNDYSTDDSDCKFPVLNPFDPSIRSFFEGNIQLNCQRKYPLLFTTNNTHLITLKDPKQYGVTNCCYRNLIRYHGSDSSIGLSRQCTKIGKNPISLPTYIEYISISCESQKSGRLLYVDMLSLVPFKSEVKLKLEILQRKLHRQKLSKYLSFLHSSNSPRVNVVMLGLDSVSHMNLFRTMPRSVNFLKEIGSSSSSIAVGMNGYTKIGDNTYPNAIGFLSGLNVSAFEAKCSLPFYDKCPFVWNSYSSQAYVTSFGEDSPGMSIFNFQKRGFNNTPVDYYLRPLTFTQDKFIGNTESSNSNLCYGPRSGFQVLIEYMTKMADTMQTSRKNYFQLIWATSLFHDSILLGKNGDETLEMFLKYMTQKGFFKNTVFVFLSDHGMRWGPFRKTWQGKLEDKMPFLYFILPKWMETEFPIAVKNLRINSKRLTTPFDLHETLQDLLQLTNIRDYKLTNRLGKLKLATTTSHSRGRSLFLPIPASRKCEDAGIPINYCVCNPSQRISSTHIKAQTASEVALAQINDILSDQTQCAKLTLKEIISAEMVIVNSNSSTKAEEFLESVIVVEFRTVPGNATFEATVKNVREKFTVVGDISRTNLYGNQSWCANTSKLKKLCFCSS